MSNEATTSGTEIPIWMLSDSVQMALGAVPADRPSKKRYPHVLQAVFGQPWAIQESKLAAICEVIEAHIRAEDLPSIEAARPSSSRNGRVAVLPVFGVLARRMNLMTEMSGGTSTERLSSELRAFDKDPDIDAVILSIDSPGGEVFGIEELAAQIRGMSTRVVAQVDGLAASAAYWIASAADRIVMTPSGQVGSIGVIARHVDQSALESNVGVKTTLITAGSGKGDADPSQPLSDDALTRIQAIVDRYYDQFVSSVVAGRNGAFSQLDGRTAAGKQRIDESTVRDEWQAAMRTSEAALEAGMVDAIGEPRDTIKAELATIAAVTEEADLWRRHQRARTR